MTGSHTTLTGALHRSSAPPQYCSHRPSSWLQQRQRSYKNELDLLQIASNVSNNANQTLSPRIAFLFLVRGSLPHERLWRRFFNNYDNLYSVYVHAKPGFEFPSKSLFHCREIPSKNVARFSFNVVDAMRRLLAHALLDTTVRNEWFVFVCESSIPVRSFRYVYDFLMNSNVSFVEAFHPSSEYYSWNTMPEFPRKKLRKGEMWMAMRRKHARMVVGDSKFYRKFKRNCKRSVRMCTPDEEYIQTLLAIQDPAGITHTIMYVDWSRVDLSKGSPFSHSAKHISPQLIRKIQNRARHVSGSPLRTGNCSVPAHTNLSATNRSYGGIKPGAVCFLFARKFSKDAVIPLAKLSQNVLGY